MMSDTLMFERHIRATVLVHIETYSSVTRQLIKGYCGLRSSGCPPLPSRLAASTLPIQTIPTVLVDNLSFWQSQRIHADVQPVSSPWQGYWLISYWCPICVLAPFLRPN